jgi:hypothetical protein
VCGEERENGPELMRWKEKYYFINMGVELGMVIEDNDR